MAFQVSPGVNVSEIDLSTVVPAVSTSIGAIAGVFRWGPVNERVLISSEVELSRRFGKPKSGYNTETFFTAADFLAYSNALYVTRVSNGDKASIIGGTIAEGGITVTNAGQDFETVPAVTITAGGGSGATASATLKVVTVAVGDSGGTGYSVGDAIVVDLGDGADASFAVSAVTGTEVTSVDIIEAGSYTAITAGYTGDEVTTTSGDGGVGLTLDISLGVEAIAVTDGGSGYTSTPTVSIVGDGINATATASVADTSVSAKYPGELGNSISIDVMDATRFNETTTDALETSIRSAFDSAPVGDDVHVAIVDTGGLISGVANTILETFADLSVVEGTLSDNGTNNYASDVINLQSSYIEIAEGLDFGLIDAGIYQLENGTDGSTESASDITDEVVAGFELYRSPEDVDISFLIQGKAIGANGVVVAQNILNIAEYRKDAIAFISPQYSDVVNIPLQDQLDNVKAFRDNTNINSSYGVMDSGYKYRYDKYNDKYVWSPLNGDIAGLCARTDNVRDPWFSPAGYNRGFIKNVIKLAYNPNKTHRDELYKRGVNPVITQPGQGTILFGDKTMQTKPSAFDRINVRRLFIVLEKAIATASKFTLFEFNDEFTRAQFVNLVEPFLRDVQGRRGIYDFRVVCDDTNNTPEVIDGNRFVGDIYVKPARAINFIQLNFVAVRTGVEFEEIVGQF